MSLDNPLLVRGVYSRFWQQPDIIVCLWLGSGSSVLFEFISKLHETGATISLACAIILGTSQCVRHWSESYHGDDFYTRRYGESLLYPLPYDAFVLLAGDLNHNSVKYLQRCESHRLDVAAISPELMTYRWFKKSQIQHYRDVAYPGTHYHVNEEGGFHIANMIVGTWCSSAKRDNISFLLHLLRVLMSSNAKCKNNSHPYHFLISLPRNNTTRMLRKT